MSNFDINLIAIIYIKDIGMQNNPQSRVNAVKDIIHREVGNLMLIHARGYKGGFLFLFCSQYLVQ